MFDFPYSLQLEKAQNVLIAGAGGGFDIFCGLPLYFALRKQGKQVTLANYSFSPLEAVRGERPFPHMVEVLPTTEFVIKNYAPELFLSQWLAQNLGESIPIFAFARTGVQPLLENYRTLVERFEIDTIILVDGGTDSLMRGDEDGLGTPGEDFCSITAVSLVEVPQKMLVCLGFGVDHYHGVSNDLTLAAIAKLSQTDAFLGSLSLLNNLAEVQQYRAACEFVFAAMPDDVSIVSSSILSALAGQYGNHHATARTRNSILWINPLMPIYWFFKLEAIVQRNLILEHLQMTEYLDQVFRKIHQFRRLHVPKQRRRQTIPD